MRSAIFFISSSSQLSLCSLSPPSPSPPHLHANGPLWPSQAISENHTAGIHVPSYLLSMLEQPLVVSLMPSSNQTKFQRFTALPGACPRSFGSPSSSNFPLSSFPGQEHVAGSYKIPTLMFYDQDGIMKMAGAEADSSAILDLAEDEGWTKAELCVFCCSSGPRGNQ